MSLIRKFSENYSVQPEKMMDTLKNVAFKSKFGITNEQLMALLIVANQYNLNPFTKEIYAYPDRGGIVPVVGVDGWVRIINADPNYDGMEFIYSDEKENLDKAKECPAWIECKIYRKDRSHPVIIREYLHEVYKPPRDGKIGPWQTHTKRMLRHKALIQCARIAFGFVGIYDPDEAENIINEPIDITPINESLKQKFQSLIKNKDGPGFVLFQKSISEREFENLYKSFPPGQKVSGKNEANEVLKSGYNYFVDLVDQIEELIKIEDFDGLRQIKYETSEEEINFILSRLPRDSFEIFRGIK